MAAHDETLRPRHVIRCTACEQLLALVGRDERLIVEADAEMTTASGSPVIICPCGARTIIPRDWDVDER